MPCLMDTVRGTGNPLEPNSPNNLLHPLQVVVYSDYLQSSYATARPGRVAFLLKLTRVKKLREPSVRWPIVSGCVPA